jgi:DNA repair exonuclease SbcCD ATPase subunit
MKNSIKISILFFIMCACNTQKEEANVDKIEAEVMAIHDEVMPKMGEIMELKSKLADKLKATDSTSNQYKSLKQKTDSLNYLLDKADNGMMDWMNQYKADTLALLSKENGVMYLTDQKAKILEVQEMTKKNLEPVKQYLNIK